MSRQERDPLKLLVDERIEALIEKDWERYQRVGERLVEMLDERNHLPLDQYLLREIGYGSN